jgi:hypothetical protein
MFGRLPRLPMLASLRSPAVSEHMLCTDPRNAADRVDVEQTFDAMVATDFPDRAIH